MALTPAIDSPRVGLLGVGLGSAMAHRLLSEGIKVVAWDRDPSHVRDLEERGAEAASSADEVVSSEVAASGRGAYLACVWRLTCSRGSPRERLLGGPAVE